MTAYPLPFDFPYSATIILAPPGDKAPNRQHHDCSERRADQTGSFVRSIPSQALAQERRDKRADDAENCGQYETGRLILSRHENFAITPAKKPIIIVQMMPTKLPSIAPTPQHKTPGACIGSDVRSRGVLRLAPGVAQQKENDQPLVWDLPWADSSTLASASCRTLPA